MAKTICETCEKRESCKTPCKEVNNILWKDNHVMERYYNDSIVVFPPFREVHFSAVNDYDVEDFATTDAFPWSSENCELRKTAVFIDRFFNRMSYEEMSEKYCAPINTLRSAYFKCVSRLEETISVLDTRREGIKAVMKQKDVFSEDQKYFLLVDVFGFTGKEVAEMFKKSRPTINKKVNRMREKYTELFHAQETEESKSADTGLSVSEMMDRMTL